MTNKRQKKSKKDHKFEAVPKFEDFSTMSSVSSSMRTNFTHELKPPDGGWGWVVVFAGFFVLLVCDGLSFSFAVPLPIFVDYFKKERDYVSWIGSLLNGCIGLMGPVASALVERFGCRFVCMLGSALGGVGLLLSCFATSVDALIVTYGIIAGCGAGLMFVSSVIVANMYFDKRRALATGIVTSGSGIGVIVLGYLTTFMVDTYGWKVGCITFSALFFQCMVLAALMKPIETFYIKVEHISSNEKTELMHSLHVSKSGTGSLSRSPVRDESPHHPHYHHHPDHKQELKDRDNLIVHYVQEKPPSSAAKPHDAHHDHPPSPERGHKSHHDHDHHDHDHHGHHDHDKVSVKVIQKDPSLNVTQVVSVKDMVDLPSIKSNRSEVTEEVMMSYPAGLKRVSNALIQMRKTSIQVDDIEAMMLDNEQLVAVIPDNDLVIYAQKETPNPFADKSIFYSGSHHKLMQRDNKHRRRGSEGSQSRQSMTFKSIIKTMMDFRIMRDKVFCLIIAINFVFNLGYWIPLTYFVDAAILNGIEEHHANDLMAVYGITNTIGRIVSGAICDLPQLNTLFIYNLNLVMIGVCTLLYPFFFTDMTASIIITVLFGFFSAACVTLRPVFLVDIMGLDAFTNAFGLDCFFYGISTVIAAPLGGLVFRLTASYQITYYIAVGLITVSTCVSFMVPCIPR